MRVSFFCAFISLLSFLPAQNIGSGQELPNDSIPLLVAQCYDNYKQAVLRQSGEEAVRYVSVHTINYYDRLADLARTADSLQLDTLPLIDKLTVLIFRARTPRDLLLDMEGEQVFVFAIDSGMVSKDDVARNSLGKVFFDESFARAPMVVNGQQTPMPLYFHLEAGHWKVDLTSMFPVAKAAFERLVEESGMQENEYFELLISILMRGNEPLNPLWEPVG